MGEEVAAAAVRKSRGILVSGLSESQAHALEGLINATGVRATVVLDARVEAMPAPRAVTQEELAALVESLAPERLSAAAYGGAAAGVSSITLFLQEPAEALRLASGAEPEKLVRRVRERAPRAFLNGGARALLGLEASAAYESEAELERECR